MAVSGDYIFSMFHVVMVTGHNFIVCYFKDQAQGIAIKGKKLVIDRVKKGEEMLPPQLQVDFLSICSISKSRY